MAETKLNTRISLRYDTYSAWNTANPKLLAGEIAVVVIPAETGAVVQEPSILFKVGDGTKTFKELGFSHALAADVYSWAKAAEKPTYTADEIDGLADYISGEIQDSNTTYTLEQDATDAHILILKKQEIGETEWTEVTRITTVDTVYDDTALDGRVTANAEAIEAVKALVGNDTVTKQISDAIAALDLANAYEAKGTAAEMIGDLDEGKTVVQMIADAQAAATYDDTKVKSDIEQNAKNIKAISDDYLKAADKQALEGEIEQNAESIEEVGGKVTTLVGADTGKSVRAIAAEELAAQLVDDNAAESLNTLEEIAAWIQSHPGDASAMNEAILALQAKVDTGDKTVTAYVTDAINALSIGDYAKAADLTALAGRVKTLEDNASSYALASDLEKTDAALEEVSGKVATLEGKSHEHANATVINGITADKVSAWDDAASKVHEHGNSDVLDGITSEKVAAWDTADGKAHEHTNADVLNGITAEKVSAWDTAESEANAYTDEKIGELSAIAASGNVNDLVQTTGDILVFNCGGAAG